MRVLVAGGSGFIGSTLVSKLAKKGCFIGVLDIKPLNIGFPLDSFVNFFQGSVCDIPSNVKALDWDVIINLAAVSSVAECEREPELAFDVNVNGSRMLLDLAVSNDASFILASSAAVYAESLDASTPSLIVSPISSYGRHKLQAEKDAFMYASYSDIPVTVFRFFNVFGPDQFMFNPSAVIPSFLCAASSGSSIQVNNSGLASRDLIPVEFVTNVIVSACLSKFSYSDPIPVCSGVSRSVLDVARLVSSFTDPVTPVTVYENFDPVSLVHSLGDNTLVSSLFPGIEVPNFTDYLKYCFDFVSENYKLVHNG